MTDTDLDRGFIPIIGEAIDPPRPLFPGETIELAIDDLGTFYWWLAGMAGEGWPVLRAQWNDNGREKIGSTALHPRMFDLLSAGVCNPKFLLQRMTEAPMVER